MKEWYDVIFVPISPRNFDENDWYTLSLTLIVFTSIYLITRKYRLFLWTEIICIYLFNLLLSTIGDSFLAMPPYDFYDTVDHNHAELMDIFLQNIIYPGTLLTIMHFYKKMKPNNILFIVLTALLLTLFELISAYIFHLFTYKTWEIYYSTLFYLFVIGSNIIFYHKLSSRFCNRINQNTNSTR